MCVCGCVWVSVHKCMCRGLLLYLLSITCNIQCYLSFHMNEMLPVCLKAAHTNTDSHQQSFTAVKQTPISICFLFFFLLAGVPDLFHLPLCPCPLFFPLVLLCCLLKSLSQPIFGFFSVLQHSSSLFLTLFSFVSYCSTVDKSQLNVEQS